MAIQNNQMVSLNYELKIDDDIIDSNLDSEPIVFKYGSGELIPGLESRIQDMNEGEVKRVEVPADEAYGQYDEKLSETLPISQFEGIDLEIGMVLEADGENGEILRATVTDATKENVTVDYNHPLAGTDLKFMVKIQKIA